MSRFPRAALAAAGLLLAVPADASAQDATAGEKVFMRCKTCHAVGEGAKNRVGPHLNDVLGRTAGALPDFKYSPAMTEAGKGGLAWNEETLAALLADPRGFVKGTKMAFAGLKKEEDLANLTAYLKTFSDAAPAGSEPATPAPEEKQSHADETPAPAAAPEASAAAPIAAHGVLHLGRAATPDEIAAWDIDISPDGAGLPEGSGTVAEGEVLYSAQCASCHGDFGEAIGRWPALAGGQGTLTDERPVKTVGSYWPYLSTVYDYIRRAMPFGNARSLSNDDVYALTAYVLYLNDIVTEEDFSLSRENFTSVKLPNESGFIGDDRFSEPHYKAAEPCMTDCKPGKAKVSMHAAVLDVTPDSEDGDEAEENQGGSID